MGYIEELNAMVEYIIKYKDGMKDGLKEQISCLQDRLRKDEVSLQDVNATEKIEAVGSIDKEAKENQEVPSVYFDDRILEIQSACDVVEPLKPEEGGSESNSVGSTMKSAKGSLKLKVGEGAGESKFKEKNSNLGPGKRVGFQL